MDKRFMATDESRIAKSLLDAGQYRGGLAWRCATGSCRTVLSKRIGITALTHEPWSYGV